MSFIDAAQLQQKALELIDRHLSQLLKDGTVSTGSAVIIQNYAKTLVIMAREQRDQQGLHNPASLTDEELEVLAAQAARTLNMETANDSDN